MRARRLFYEGLASMLGAGIPVRTAMDHLAAGVRGGFGEALRHLSSAVLAGLPVSGAMQDRPRAFPRHHAELVRAAESSGTVDRAFRALGEEEAAAERLAGKILSRSLYPLAVVHFAAVPLNITLLSQGRFLSFAGAVLLCWLPLWAALAAGWWLLRRARTGGVAAAVVLRIPFLGGMLRDRALLRWARVFAALDDAGAPADVAAERAAAATGLAALEGPLARPAAALRAGSSRSAAFAGAPLPVPFQAALARGEQTGTVAESLSKEASAMEFALEAKGESLVALLPVASTILAGVVVFFVAMKVLGGVYSIK